MAEVVHVYFHFISFFLYVCGWGVYELLTVALLLFLMALKMEGSINDHVCKLSESLRGSWSAASNIYIDIYFMLTVPSTKPTLDC